MLRGVLNLRVIDVIAVALGLATNAAVWSRARAGQSPLPLMSPHPVALHSPAVPDDTLAAAEQRVRDRDPFGLAATPVANPAAKAPFPPGPPMPMAGLPPGIGQPAMTVQAVAGPPWTAVLSGIPGHPAQTVVAIGDTLGGVRIRAIRHDTVFVQKGDSVLHLTFARNP